MTKRNRALLIIVSILVVVGVIAAIVVVFFSPLGGLLPLHSGSAAKHTGV